jgi:hypothetical protein
MVWKVGPIMRSNSRDSPNAMPKASPAVTPMARPMRSRRRLAVRARARSPLSNCCTAVSHTLPGGTSNGEVDQCKRAASHHSNTSAMGRIQPRRAGGTG